MSSVAQKRAKSAARISTRRQFLQVESLEDRKMNALVGLAVDGGGTLNVIADDTADTITVYKSGTTTVVQATNAAGVTSAYNVGTAASRMIIRTNGGNDTVNNLTPMTAVIYGGTGNDTLNGGGIDDALFGEAGNDVLTGNGGADILRGGEGNDTLNGNDGNDRLFGEGGFDYLSGGNDDDFLDSGAATETNWTGGAGNDFNAYQTVVNGAAFNDIDQRVSNNCFILGAMGEAAQHGLDMNGRITYLGGGVYNVSLFKLELQPGGMRYMPTNVIVAFDGSLKDTDPAPHFRGQEGESWTVIMNRALAQLLNKDLATITGGYAGDVFAALYGRAPSTTTWQDPNGNLGLTVNDGVLDYLYQVGNSRPTIVSTYLAAARDTTLFAEAHVYMVNSVAISHYVYSPYTRTMLPQYLVTLYNPHGKDNDGFGTVAGARSSGDNNDGLITITGAEFKRSFREITTG